MSRALIPACFGENYCATITSCSGQSNIKYKIVMLSSEVSVTGQSNDWHVTNKTTTKKKCRLQWYTVLYKQLTKTQQYSSYTRATVSLLIDFHTQPIFYAHYHLDQIPFKSQEGFLWAHWMNIRMKLLIITIYRSTYIQVFNDQFCGFSWPGWAFLKVRPSKITALRASSAKREKCQSTEAY